MTSLINPDDLLDVRECRAVAQAFEVRSTGHNIARITGYASVFNRGYDVHGGPTAGGWTEVVTPPAFKRTLGEDPHVHLLINHEGLPLASTKSKTLRLSTDSVGLITEAEVDRRNSRANDMLLTLERGDVDEMSFAFRVKSQSWSDDGDTRSLDEVSLHKGDVSVVSFGANPFTSVSVRNAVRVLANQNLSDEQIEELRSMSDDVDRAVGALRAASANEKRSVPTNIHVGDQRAFVKAVHDMAVTAGANCDSDGVVETPLRALSPMLDDGTQGLEPSYPDADASEGSDSLMQAVHDLVADAAHDDDIEVDSADNPVDNGSYSGRNFSVADAIRVSASDGNLSLSEAARMCRPDEAPDPLSIAQASELSA